MDRATHPRRRATSVLIIAALASCGDGAAGDVHRGDAAPVVDGEAADATALDPDAVAAPADGTPLDAAPDAVADAAPDAPADAAPDAPADAAVDGGPPPPRGAREHCSADGWCWDRPLTGNALYAVWGASADDVWAVGDAGTILHFDGVEWRVVPSGIDTPLRAVAGSGPEDVWAVGDAGTILHFDGQAWRRTISGTDATFTDVAATARDRAWAAAPGQGLFRWNGGLWRPEAGPVAPSAVAAADGDVWAVGESGLGPRIMRHDGATWSEEILRSYRMTPFDVAALPVTEAWAVGRFRADTGALPGLALHLFAGSSRLFTVDPDRGLLDVFARSASEVWAVGERGLVARWDGFTWTTPIVPVTSTLNGVWSAAPGDVWAVGDGGMLLHLEGATWTTVDQPALTGADELVALPAGDVIARAENHLWRRDRDGWRPLIGPGGALRGLWARAHDDVMILNEAGLHRWDGVRWRLELAATSGSGVWGTGDDLWVASWYAVAHRAGAGAFTPLPELRGVWGLANPSGVGWARGPDDVYVVASGFQSQQTFSYLLRWDGATWALVREVPGDGRISAVTGNASELAVIIDGAIETFDGRRWTRRAEPRCSALALDAGSRLEAACTTGVQRRDGGAWSLQALPMRGGPSRLAVSGGWAWAAGRGVLLRRAPPAAR